MWRLSALRRVSLSSSVSRAYRPYQRVLAVMDDGQGLLAAEAIFHQFKEFYYQEVSQNGSSAFIRGAAECTPGASPREPNTHHVNAVVGAPGPLTKFCGRHDEVDSFTVLLLKVLCDLQKFEEMRFLFAQCVLELQSTPPSTELFNVYLLAISLTDTFNEHEIDNVVELMRTKGTPPDVVTKLSLFMLFLRLGREQSGAMWPFIRVEVQSLIDEGRVTSYPLLAMRLQHCFQTVLRVHYDMTVVRECFDLLHAIDPNRLTKPLLLPYMVLSVTNAAVSPRAVVDVLEFMEERSVKDTSEPLPSQEAKGGESSMSSLPEASEAGDAAVPSHVTPSKEPALNNELTTFRLLSKCAKWRDPSSALYVRRYLRRYSNKNIITPENQPLASLLYLEALVQAGGNVSEAFDVIEHELPAPFCWPGERPKLFLQSMRLLLLNTDPISNFVGSIAGTAGDSIDRILAFLLQRAGEKDGGDDNSEMVAAHTINGKAAVITARSLDLVMAACAFIHDAERAEYVLERYVTVSATPTTFTYASLLNAYAGSMPSAGVARLPALLQDMQAMGVAVDSFVLRAAMHVALSAQDVEAALRVAEMHVDASTSMDTKQSMQLIQELVALVDASGMRRAFQAMRFSKSVIDPRSVTMCTDVLGKWGIPCDDLQAALRE